MLLQHEKRHNLLHCSTLCFFPQGFLWHLEAFFAQRVGKSGGLGFGVATMPFLLAPATAYRLVSPVRRF